MSIGTHTRADTTDREQTIIGVDPGVNNIAVVAPANPSIDDDMAVIDGSPVRDLFNQAYQELNAVAAKHDPSWQYEVEIISELGKEADELVNSAVDGVITHCENYPEPIIALEESGRKGRQSFSDVASYSMGSQLGEWLIPTFNRRLTAAAADSNIRLERIPGKNSSQICHACGNKAEITSRSLECSTANCQVDTIDRDRNAAIVHARRLEGSLEVPQ